MFNLANVFTGFNLICGLLSICLCFSGQLEMAAYAIFLGAFFDFTDGFIARKLKLESAIGKQLDSLADLVTFGVAPGFLMFFMILLGIDQPDFLENFNHAIQYTNGGEYYIHNTFFDWINALFYDIDNNFNASIKYIPFVAFLIPFFSLFRLAKFNVDEKQSKDFIGVPTPLNAIIICFFPLYFSEHLSHWDTQTELVHWLFDCYTLAIISVILAVSLILPIPFMSMKLEGTSKTENYMKISLVIIALVSIPVFKVLSIPIIITLYFLISMYHSFKKSKNEI
jgi:CDP-diacylglycerol--serine O-phosphatidyltransferase